MIPNYKKYRDELAELIGKLKTELPGPLGGFSELNRKALQEGSLTRKSKEQIALGIAIAVRCDGCIAFHVKAALDAGNTREELLEVIGVAILMGGGPAMIYGSEAYAALDQFCNQ